MIYVMLRPGLQTSYAQIFCADTKKFILIDGLKQKIMHKLS